MNTCTRCPAPARWRDADGRHYCAGHVPANGKPLARLPAPEVPDIADRLEWWSGNFGHPVVEELCLSGAAEIRRLRALVDAAGDKSGAC
jgi:hypothetical protein